MHEDYKNFVTQQRLSIVEVFSGYVPPSRGRPAPNPLPNSAKFEVIAESGTRSLQLIPSRFDFADTLLGAVRPNPKMLSLYLTSNFQHKDLIIIDCSPTESILTTAAYHASGAVLVPVKPEYFATIGFPLLRQSLDNFKNQNRGQTIAVAGVVINNAFYDGGNSGGPEKKRAMKEIEEESKKNGWRIFANEIPHSRGFPKMMRGDNLYRGNAQYFSAFAAEFFGSIGL
jgi:chromosome partitioning protein